MKLPHIVKYTDKVLQGDSIAYWVGTTRSSSEKNKLLNQK